MTSLVNGFAAEKGKEERTYLTGISGNAGVIDMENQYFLKDQDLTLKDKM